MARRDLNETLNYREESEARTSVGCGSYLPQCDLFVLYCGAVEPTNFAPVKATILSMCPIGTSFEFEKIDRKGGGRIKPVRKSRD